MHDFSDMPKLKLLVVGGIQPESNKFATGLENEATGDLKRHCHAIWQLYKMPEGIFASIEFQN